MTAILFLALNCCEQLLTPSQFQELLKECHTPTSVTLEMMYDLIKKTSPNFKATIVDISPEAIDKASRLSESIECNQHMHFEVADAFYFDRYSDYSIVHVASMIPNKLALLHLILAQTRQRGGDKIFLRRISSLDPRQLFYEPLDRSCVEQMLLEANLDYDIVQSNPSPDWQTMTGYFVLCKNGTLNRENANV